MVKPANEYTLQEQLEEVERELKMRKSFYERQIAQKRMRRDTANAQYNKLLAVRNTLKSLIKPEPNLFTNQIRDNENQKTSKKAASAKSK